VNECRSLAGGLQCAPAGSGVESDDSVESSDTVGSSGGSGNADRWGLQDTAIARHVMG
jgi:hypothetical protein